MLDKTVDQVTLPGTIDLRTHIHKLNNLITVIQGNAHLIKLRPDSKDDAEEILEACEQIGNVLKVLRIEAGGSNGY